MDFLEDEMKEILNIFRIESEEIITRLNNSLLELEKKPNNKELILLLFRDAHSLKGASRMVGFTSVQNLAHKLEDVLGLAKESMLVLNAKIADILYQTVDMISLIIQKSLEKNEEVVDEAKVQELTIQLENIKDFEDMTNVPKEIITFNLDTLVEHIDVVNKLLIDSLICLLKLEEAVTPELIDEMLLYVSELYTLIEQIGFFEIKLSVENVKVKLEFVQKASYSLTNAEIIELQNEFNNVITNLSELCATNGLAVVDYYAKAFDNDTLDVEIAQNVKVVEAVDFERINQSEMRDKLKKDAKRTSVEEVHDEKSVSEAIEPQKVFTLDFDKIFDTKEIKTLHVDSKKLDLLVNQVGELIMSKIKITNQLNELNSLHLELEAWQKEFFKNINYLKNYEKKFSVNGGGMDKANLFLNQALTMFANGNQNLINILSSIKILTRTNQEDDTKMRLLIDELNSMVKNVRVLPLATVFHLFGRMVRDIAKENNKKIELTMSGSEISADKKIIEEIKTPLIHIIRNAIDHGIESPEVRVSKGKPAIGKIALNAMHLDNKIVIEIIDDGQGFNLDKIKEKALANGFLTREEVESMDSEEIMNIIFWPGFTTGDEVTNLSGRGIGLDVVKTKISQLNGTVKVISEINRGSCVRIELPVTMATIKSFLVKSGNQTFAIPMSAVKTVVSEKSTNFVEKDKQLTLLYEDKPIMVYNLADILQLPKILSLDKKTILVIESNNKMIGLMVDKLIGDQEILHKKLSAPINRLKNISGITTLASGEICLILNIADIIKNAMSYNYKELQMKSQALLTEEQKISTYKRILAVDDSATIRTLVKNILSKSGYEVITVENPILALSELEQSHFDLIVSDVDMPEMNGFEFLNKVKTNELYADIPVIILSSLSSNEDKLNAYNLGALGYIVKTELTPKRLTETVASVLNKSNSFEFRK